MSGPRLAGVLWLVAGISSAAIAFFITDAPTLVLFIAGAVLASVLGILLLGRPSARLVTWSSLLGVAWLVGYGAATIGNLNTPIEELLSVVWVLAFGVAAAAVAYVRRPATI